MTETSETPLLIDDFIDQWEETPNKSRKAFLGLKSHLERKNGVTFDFMAREGLTYSLRASRENQLRPLFAMIDVIEDEPRWLSVCFFGDMINDPEEKGDFVPGGLLGEDGHCFDLEEYDEGDLAYLKKRIDEAFEKAS